MTEAEAENKWCPFARVSFNDGGGFNRLIVKADENDALCIGSACMAWRTDYHVIHTDD